MQTEAALAFIVFQQLKSMMKECGSRNN